MRQLRECETPARLALVEPAVLAGPSPQTHPTLLPLHPMLSRHLAAVLHLDNYRFDARQAILLDYASYAIE